MTDVETRVTPKRGTPVKAKPGQLVTYILTDHKFFRHGTIEAAKTERAYLEAKTGKKFKLLKVIECSSEDLALGTVVVTRKEPADDR